MCAKTSSKSFYHYDEVVCHKRWILDLSTISIYSPIQEAQRILISGRLGDYSERENVISSTMDFLSADLLIKSENGMACITTLSL